jgi:hypothetical protein
MAMAAQFLWNQDSGAIALIAMFNQPCILISAKLEPAAARPGLRRYTLQAGEKSSPHRPPACLRGGLPA